MMNNNIYCQADNQIASDWRISNYFHLEIKMESHVPANEGGIDDPDQAIASKHSW